VQQVVAAVELHLDNFQSPCLFGSETVAVAGVLVESFFLLRE
jgi:hypothetical protein